MARTLSGSDFNPSFVTQQVIHLADFCFLELELLQLELQVDFTSPLQDSEQFLVMLLLSGAPNKHVVY